MTLISKIIGVIFWIATSFASLTPRNDARRKMFSIVSLREGAKCADEAIQEKLDKL